jgi:hypothetical protein
MGVDGPSAAGDLGDTGTTIANGEVEADGTPGALEAISTSEADDSEPTKGDEEAAIALGDEERVAIPGGVETISSPLAIRTTLDNTGSRRVLPCMKVCTREGCRVQGADVEERAEPPEAIRCGECTRARSTNSLPLGVVGELLYGVKASVTPVDGASAFP